MTKTFFEAFEEARHELTIGDEDAPELNVLQPGLVAVFFLDKSYERREAISRVLAMYCERYGDKMKWGYFSDDMRNRTWDSKMLAMCQQYLVGDPANAVYFRWSSEVGFGYVGDYTIDAFSDTGWFEQVHKSLSYLRFYLPVEELADGGTQQLQEFLSAVCDLLKPIHGYMGLGIQQSHDDNPFQAMEYELAQEFNGLEVASPLSLDELRAGFKSINWYTILDQQWIDKLGGAESLRTQFNDERIQLIPYAHGLIVKAGEWPELGWVKRNPFPELYVKVNRVLKPVRAPELECLHNGSIAGEARFSPRSSNLWLRRFDDAPEAPPTPAGPSPRGKVVSLSPAAKSDRLRCEAGQPCPRAGFWFTPAQVGSRRLFKPGEVMPEFKSDYGATIWQWDEVSQDPPKP